MTEMKPAVEVKRMARMAESAYRQLRKKQPLVPLGALHAAARIRSALRMAQAREA